MAAFLTQGGPSRVISRDPPRNPLRGELPRGFSGIGAQGDPGEVEEPLFSPVDILPALGGLARLIKFGSSDVPKDLRAILRESTGSRSAPKPPASLNLTNFEREWMTEMFENPANRAEMLEAVPSLRLEKGRLLVDNKDMRNFLEFLDDTVIAEMGPSGPGLRTMPPRFRNMDASINKFQNRTGFE